MRIKPSTPGLTGRMVNRNIYADTALLYQKYSAKPPVVVDGGACVGASVNAFESVIPGCTIHSFEANPNLYAGLVKKFKNKTNVHVHNNVLSDITGTESFQVTDYVGSGSIHEPTSWSLSMHGNKVLPRRSVQIPSLRLDDADFKTDIIKLDIQGAELKALNGAAETLKHTKLVFMEVMFVNFYKNQPTYVDLHSFSTV